MSVMLVTGGFAENAGQDGASSRYKGGALVWYCQYAWLWYLQCCVTHQGEIQEPETSQV